MNAFEFEDVAFSYSGHNVFTHLNLQIPAGAFLGIVGGNGSGKSTLLKLCVGGLRPDHGEVKILGQSIPKFRRWHKVGYVPQNPLRDKSFPATVEEIAAMGRVASLGIGRRLGPVDRNIITEVLQKVGMNHLRRQ